MSDQIIEMGILKQLTSNKPQIQPTWQKMAIEEDNLIELVNKEADEWPLEETKELVVLL